jgi:hypothetical protein
VHHSQHDNSIGDVASHPARELPAHLIPRDGRARVRDVFRHASIQFRLLLGSKRQLGLALSACETLPQRHDELDPFAGGELEELSEGVWLHTAVFP